MDVGRRAHLSEVNAHARTEHYFVCARGPRLLRCEKKEEKNIPYPTRFQIVSHIALVGPTRENGRNFRGEARRVFPNFHRMFRTRRYSQRSNTAVLSGLFNICVASRSGEKRGLSYDACGKPHIFSHGARNTLKDWILNQTLCRA